jgi:hypothetical protein
VSDVKTIITEIIEESLQGALRATRHGNLQLAGQYRELVAQWLALTSPNPVESITSVVERLQEQGIPVDELVSSLITWIAKIGAGTTAEPVTTASP